MSRPSGERAGSGKGDAGDTGAAPGTGTPPAREVDGGAGAEGMVSDPWPEADVDRLASEDTVFRPGLFADQVVLVTGGAGGIGTALCVLFGRLGARIVACGRDEGRLGVLAEGLARVGIEAMTVPMTVRDPEAVAELVARTWDEMGRLDVVVNNAGGQFAAPALDITPKGWHAVIDTNLNGTWYVMQAAAREWVRRERGGVIANMVTITGRAAVGIPHTAASRAGAINLSQSLAVEWAPWGIRVNCIALGVIASPGLRNYPPTARPSFDHNPMRRMGELRDVAEACVYLCAPSGRFITGAVLPVTGGGHVWGEYWPLGKPEWFRVPDE